MKVPLRKLSVLSVPLFTMCLTSIPLRAADAGLIRLPLEDDLNKSEIVCIADVIDEIPAAEPTPETPRTEAIDRLCVRHVWKGDVGDTLLLHALHGKVWSAHGKLHFLGPADGFPSLRPGQRYLLFASHWQGNLTAMHRTSKIGFAEADIIHLLRTVGPGRRVGDVDVSRAFPSFRSLLRDVAVGDSAAQQYALYAFYDLDDSSETGVPVLEQALGTAKSVTFRRCICNALGFWSGKTGEARRVLLNAFESPDARLRLAAVEANSYGNPNWLKGAMLPRLEDRDPEVREAALKRMNEIERKDRGELASLYFHALDDSSASVRLVVVRCLEQMFPLSFPGVIAALQKAASDPDSAVAALSRNVLSRRR